MGVIRLLLILVAIFLIYLLIKKYFRSLQKPKATERPPIAENMVRCVHCGVNVPQTEAIYSRGEYYCSEEHRRISQQ